MAADSGAGRASLAQELTAALLARRVVMVNGRLDHAQASEAAAALMTLDALGDEHIELRINSSTSSFEAGLVLIDVMEVLGVPIHTVGMGVIGGGMVGVLATGARRAVSRHARLHLREPDVEVAGRASEIERALAEEMARRELFHRHLARCTGRPLGEIEAQWAPGRFLTAEDAATLGYVDELLG